MIERARRLDIVETICSVMDEHGNTCTEGNPELDMAPVSGRKQDDDEVRRLDRLELVRADGSQVVKCRGAIVRRPVVCMRVILREKSITQLPYSFDVCEA